MFPPLSACIMLLPNFAFVFLCAPFLSPGDNLWCAHHGFSARLVTTLLVEVLGITTYSEQLASKCSQA